MVSSTMSETDPNAESELVDRCRRRLLATLPGPPRTLAALRAALEKRTGRPVRVVVSDPGGLDLPSGLWLQLRDRDVVWVDSRTSLMHQVVIIGHEFGHMVCGHQPQPVHDEAELADPVPAFADQELGLSAAHITAIMGRCSNRTLSALGRPECSMGEAELEAEVTGRMIAEHLLALPDVGLAESLAGP